MNIKPTLLILLSTILISHSNISQAGNDRQSHSSIVEAAEQFLSSQNSLKQYSKKTIKIGHIDPRLSLAKCQESLDTYLAPGAKVIGKTTVGVRCNAPKPWALYVPVTVNVYQHIYQTATHLPKGHVIGEADIESVEHDLSQLHRGYFTDKSKIIGQQTRRHLNQSKVLTPSSIKPALLVKRGERVALQAKSKAYTVKMNGTAMMDGAKGEKIRVKNLSSERIIEGIVTQNGVVTIYN